MELQTFIEQSLSQIISGIAAAGEAAKRHGAIINPSQEKWEYGQAFYFDRGTGLAFSNVEFDIAVTASADTKTKGGIGVSIASVVLGSQGESSKVNQQVSRIKFSIPIVLPSSMKADEVHAGEHVAEQYCTPSAAPPPPGTKSQ